LGYVGDVLDVADGYARNYLIPRSKALLANPRNVKSLEHAKRITAQKAKKVAQGLQEVADRMSKVSLSFSVKTGKDDKLFGSVTSKDIEEALRKEGFDVDRRRIQLSQPIKELGVSTIGVKLHPDIVAHVTVTTVKIGGETSEDAKKSAEGLAAPADAAPETSESEG
jgi:large subunit ribosomal protein L9